MGGQGAPSTGEAPGASMRPRNAPFGGRLRRGRSDDVSSAAPVNLGSVRPVAAFGCGNAAQMPQSGHRRPSTLGRDAALSRADAVTLLVHSTLSDSKRPRRGPHSKRACGWTCARARSLLRLGACSQLRERTNETCWSRKDILVSSVPAAQACSEHAGRSRAYGFGFGRASLGWMA